MVKFFKSRNVPKITKQIEGSIKIGTTAVREGYVMFVHPNAEFLYRDITGFVKQELYANTSTVMDGEIGMIEDVRIIVSTIVKELTTLSQLTETGGATVTGTPSDSGDTWYQSVLLGADAYGIVPLAGQTSAQVLVSPFKATGNDPLAQRATVGWKAATGCIILDPQRVIVYNHGLS
jgi:N4-gp56 family major capsid protein